MAQFCMMAGKQTESNPVTILLIKKQGFSLKIIKDIVHLMHKWPQIIVVRFIVCTIHNHSKLRKDFSFSDTIDRQQPNRLSSGVNYYENTHPLSTSISRFFHLHLQHSFMLWKFG